MLKGMMEVLCGGVLEENAARLKFEPQKKGGLEIQIWRLQTVRGHVWRLQMGRGHGLTVTIAAWTGFEGFIICLTWTRLNSCFGTWTRLNSHSDTWTGFFEVLKVLLFS